MAPLMAGQMPVVVVSLRLGLAKPQHQKERSFLVGHQPNFPPRLLQFFYLIGRLAQYFRVLIEVQIEIPKRR